MHGIHKAVTAFTAVVAIGAATLTAAPSATAATPTHAAVSSTDAGSTYSSERTAAATNVVAVEQRTARRAVRSEAVRSPLTSTHAARAKMSWGKVLAFAGCIFGVGVPIGLGWAIATYPPVWAWVMGRGAFPASLGGAASKYLGTVKRWCAYALF